MQNLINDLLVYSRVGTHGNELKPVSAEYLLSEALTNLQLTMEESGATVTHDPLPIVQGDPLQLAMVFQNLLGNGIKFRGSVSRARKSIARDQPSIVVSYAWISS